MHSTFSFSLLVPFLLLHFLTYPSLSSTLDPLSSICGTKGNYTANSTYKTNLESLLSSFSAESIAAVGFSRNTTGAAPDQVYGFILCCGDTNSTYCSSCIDQATQDVVDLCPFKKGAVIWYDYCILQYSNEEIISSYHKNSVEILMWNVQNVSSDIFSGWNESNGTKRSLFTYYVASLLNGTSGWAVDESPKLLFSTGIINIPSFPVTYSLAQCVRDMSNGTCYECLKGLVEEIRSEFDGRQGARILGDRCSLRYETYKFFSGDALYVIGSSSPPPPPPMTSSPPSSPPQGGGKSNKIAIIAGSIAGALVLVGCSTAILWIRHCSKQKLPEQESSLVLASTSTTEAWNFLSEQTNPEFSLFHFSQIEKATNEFSLDNKLGQGGFGPVYKGVLPDGLEIAVKRLSAHSGQGIVEFKNEIHLIEKLQHRNLVRLVGWCVKEQEKILVYEFMPNKSLDFFIFDETRGILLNWEKRFQIIEGIAQGLLYLHKHSRLRIIHRDLKTSNILLDSDMTPKISDFGLARIFGANELQANTNRVVGTYGYMAPEYASEGLFSIKSDVYSFGVLLLEIVSGKRNMGYYHDGNFHNFMGYAWKQWQGGEWPELIDPILTETSETEIERCIHVALLCVQESPVDRPTMSDVVSFLSKECVTLPEPKQPAYFNVRIADHFDGSPYSLNDASITNPEGR